jgi:uncharacterized protein
MPKGFGERTYQQWMDADYLCSFRVTVRETVLLILAREDLSEIATQQVHHCRGQIEAYIARYPDFQASFEPLDVDNQAPLIIYKMASASRLAGVGPFAAVAGAVAESVGHTLLAYSDEVIVENGGDVFIASHRDRTFGIYAGESPLTGKLGLRIKASQMPCGVCTSSGIVGPSTSYGRADAAIVIAKSTILADACATALGNVVKSIDDIAMGINFIKEIEGVDGAVVIVESNIGAWGDFEFVKTVV